MKSAPRIASLFFLVALGAVSVLDCRSPEPAAAPAAPAEEGSVAPSMPPTMEHGAVHTDLEPSDSTHAGHDEATPGSATHVHEANVELGGMNVPELGDYDPADWSDQPGAEVGDVTRCPVSGDEFRVTEESTFFEHNGEKVYFCCPSCIRQFQRNPDALLAAAFPSEGSGEK